MTAVDYRSLATLLVHAGIGGSSYGAVAMPVFESASFVLEDMEHHHAAIDDANSLAYYSRGYNPTVAALEARLAAAVYDAFELIMRATSLGDVATLVASADNPDVLRISTGTEAPDDLAADLTQALDAAL